MTEQKNQDALQKNSEQVIEITGELQAEIEKYIEILKDFRYNCRAARNDVKLLNGVING